MAASRRALATQESSASPTHRSPITVTLTDVSARGSTAAGARFLPKGTRQRKGSTFIPASAAACTHCWGRQLGPHRQVPAGRFRTGQDRCDNHETRKAFISAATYSRSEEAMCTSSCSKIHGRRTRTPRISLSETICPLTTAFDADGSNSRCCQPATERSSHVSSAASCDAH